MNDIIDTGFAERVPKEEATPDNGRFWYLPHHDVYHPKKTERIRVVFECSACFMNESLNRHLLQGPDLTNSLVGGVLCRFQREKVAFMCDIQGMFHQVNVDAEFRNYLRLLWREQPDFDQEPVEYRITVHLFVASSSPWCANFAHNKQTADDFESEFGKESADFVRSDFYVNDGLKSVSASSAITLTRNTKAL